VALDVLGQRRTIRERPVVGIAHALVFWGFVAFAGYTSLEFLRGMGIADLTGSPAFAWYRRGLAPFAVAVLVGISGLLIRRTVVRPAALGRQVSRESVVIALLISTLMATFLFGLFLGEDSLPGRVNWWVHALVVLGFLVLIPSSKHLHLVLSPFTIFLKAPELGRLENLDFEKEEVGLETVQDLPKKSALDAFTCVECGRCQDNCPAWGAGKALNPKTVILQTREALLAGTRERQLGDVYGEDILWQCTTCGACENQCPVGVEHVPLLVGARRGLVSNGAAPAYLGGVYNNLERRHNIWGLGYDPRQAFIDSAGVEIFDPARHEWLVWLGCAGAFEADYQKSLRALFDILRAKQVTFGVLAKERCSGDVARRSGNEYVFQELAGENVRALTAGGARKILTSCPHCLKTLGEDYRRAGFEADVVHSSVFVAGLLRDAPPAAPTERVTFHDPCYLGRYAGVVDEPRDLLARHGAEIAEPVRTRDNPFCCGAGGGLLFADKEEEPGTRISDVRFKQLQDTGAPTVVTACPFCSIMLKGAQATAQADTVFVDLMTFVNGRMTKV
ncbi:MAG: (Fe-S)-binding protein, partial [Acidobacteriota bacterium]